MLVPDDLEVSIEFEPANLGLIRDVPSESRRLGSPFRALGYLLGVGRKATLRARLLGWDHGPFAFPV